MWMTDWVGQKGAKNVDFMDKIGKWHADINWVGINSLLVSLGGMYELFGSMWKHHG